MKLLSQAVMHRAVSGEEDNRARQMITRRWRSALASGLRAALACTIVGLVSLYAPPALRCHITFPAFSYVVTVIVVTDATLGTALRGAVSALQATLMGAAPSVLALWLAHRTGAEESVLATSTVVALTTFAVSLPESVGPVAKRIALGQIIIIYVARFQQGERPTLGFALLHPANVVACTALGVAAALLAVLVPWPRLATSEAQEKSKAYKLLAAERVSVMSDAFLWSLELAPVSACRRRRRWRMAACMSEAKRLASASTTLLHRVNSVREDVRWERALDKASRICKWAQAAEYQDTEMETPLTGMQMALTMIRDAGTDKQENIVGDLVMTIKDQVRLALLAPSSSRTSMKQSIRINGKALLAMLSRGYDQQQLAPLLFLFSLYQIHRGSGSTTSDLFTISHDNSNVKQVAPAAAGEKKEQLPPKTKVACQNMLISRRRLMAAAKCGFSLGLAVLLGLLFSNDHGFWSGLIVATTMASGRDSTWALGIARAHGTALGSIYGVLSCLLISQRQLLTMDLRFLALFPWMVLATFLKRSRAYGPAGGVAAALSAIIIMGRRYDEPPMAFTIARLVETFIGISCAILANLVFQPGGRPSVQAREYLTRCIAALKDCFAAPLHHRTSVQVHQQLALLRKYMAEARSEPTYLWLPPFPASAYDKIEGSLSRMTQLLQLCLQARAAALMCSETMEDLDPVDDDFNRVVSSSLNHCLQLATKSLSSVQVHQDETSLQGHDDDIEAGGHGAKCSSTGCSSCCCDEEERALIPEEVVRSFIAHVREASLLQEEEEGLGVCCLALASMGLCMGEIMNEALRLEAHILDFSLQHR